MKEYILARQNGIVKIITDSEMNEYTQVIATSVDRSALEKYWRTKIK